MLARTATANGATFVDTYTPTTGHDACQSPDVKDVEGLIPTSLAYPFHPNRRGERGHGRCGARRPALVTSYLTDKMMKQPRPTTMQ
jgi:hypothetical protein